MQGLQRWTSLCHLILQLKADISLNMCQGEEELKEGWVGLCSDYYQCFLCLGANRPKSTGTGEGVKNIWDT